MVFLLGLCILSLFLIVNCDKRSPTGSENTTNEQVESILLIVPGSFKAPAGPQTLDILAVAQDKNGVGIPGVKINFKLVSADQNNPSNAYISKPDSVTDDDGIIRAKYSVTLDEKSVEDEITALVDNNSDLSSSKMINISLLDKVIGDVTLGVANPVLIIGNAVSISNSVSATILDTSGAGISGLRVNFSSNYGTFSTVDTTDLTGKVTAQLTVTNAEIHSDSNAIDLVVNAKVSGKAPVSAKFTVMREAIMPSSITLTATPKDVILAEGDQGVANINVVIKDDDGVGVAGWLVDLWIEPTSGGTLTAPPATNASGETSTKFKSNQMGTSAISAYVFGSVYNDSTQQTYKDSVEITFTPLSADVGTISVTANPSLLTVAAGGTDSSIVQARVVDNNNIVIPNLQVNFSASDNKGALSQPTLTNSQGVSTVIFYTDGDTGDVVITAKVGVASGTANIEIKENSSSIGAPDNIDIFAKPASIVLAGNDEGVDTITVVVKDGNGKGVPGQLVDLSLEPETYGFIAPAVETNSSGVTTTILRSRSIPDGDHSVEVTATLYVISSGGLIPITESTKVQFIPLDNAVGSVKVWADPAEISVSTGGTATSTVYARVVDNDNTAIPNLKVTFSASNGALSKSTLTDTTGLAQTTYYADGFTGTATISATIGEWSDDTDIIVRPQGSGSLVMTSDKDIIYADGVATHATIKAVLKNSRNEAIIGDTIHFFSALSCSKIASFIATDSTGTATTIFDDIGAGCVTALVTDTVIARYDPLNLEDTLFIDIQEIPAVDSIKLSSTAATGMRGNGVDSAFVYAYVYLENGEPAPTGTEIHFDVALGTILPGDTIVHSGRATAKLIAPLSTGVDTLRAIWQKGAITVSAEMLIPYLTGNPANIELMDGSVNELRVGESDTIFVMIKDSVGHGIGPNHPVYWSTTLGSVPAISQTDHTGLSYAILSAQTEAGLAQVTVKTSGVQDSLSLGIPILPGDPNSIQIFSNVDQIQVQGTGGQESAIMTAQVVDVGGNDVSDGFPVRFIRMPPSPDVLFGNGDTTTTVRTISGEARVSLNSGVESGPVRIRAILDTMTTSMGDTIWSEVTNINVVSGQPYYIDLDYSNDPEPDVGGTDLKIEVNARVQDMYGNNVPEGTAVFFSVDTTYHNNWYGPFAHVDGSATIQDTTGVAFSNLHYNSEATFLQVDLIAKCTSHSGIWITDVVNISLPLYEGELDLTVNPTSYIFLDQNDYTVMTVTAKLIDGFNTPINNARINFNCNLGTYFCADSSLAAATVLPINWRTNAMWRRVQYTGPNPPPLMQQPTPLTQGNGQAKMFMRAQYYTSANDYPGIPGLLGAGNVTGTVEAEVTDYPSVSADAVTVYFYEPPTDE
jgi:hypothetical protein